MKRLRRILWNSLTAASALVCVAALILWPRSYFHSDEVYHLRDTYVVRGFEKTAEASNWWIDTRGGALEIYHEYSPPGEYWDGPQESENDVKFSFAFDEHMGERALQSSGYLSADVPRFAGFAHQTDIGGAFSFTRVPLWAIAVLASLMPLRALLKYARTRRRRIGRCCLACGYDLTGNVSGVCPECGAEVTARILAAEPADR